VVARNCDARKDGVHRSCKIIYCVNKSIRQIYKRIKRTLNRGGISELERKHVNSSNINSIGYDEANYLLEIEFKNGGIYIYSSVPKDAYNLIINAPSQGKYFNEYIRKEFACTRVK